MEEARSSMELPPADHLSYLQVCLVFDAGVRVRLLPKPGSKTWHEVGDSLNNDRPLAPWYVVEQLLVQNCCLLGVQEVGEIAQPEHIYIKHL